MIDIVQPYLLTGIYICCHLIHTPFTCTHTPFLGFTNFEKIIDCVGTESKLDERKKMFPSVLLLHSSNIKMLINNNKTQPEVLNTNILLTYPRKDKETAKKGSTAIWIF